MKVLLQSHGWFRLYEAPDYPDHRPIHAFIQEPLSKMEAKKSLPDSSPIRTHVFSFTNKHTTEGIPIYEQRN